MIVGPDENHESYQVFIDPQGETRAEFIGRKLRLAPAHYGMGCFVESIHSGEILKAGRDVMHKTGYRGVGGVQFKRDDRDGRNYLVEMGIRHNVYTGLAVACGIDLPYYAYMTCIGRPFSVPTRYPGGKCWWNPADDLRAMRTYARDGSWTWGQWFASILRFPTNAYFQWRDPMPGLVLLKRVGAAAGRRIFGVFGR
jgi:predicted ATP-grasp superfamily ATP-dependent carboligase